MVNQEVQLLSSKVPSRIFSAFNFLMKQVDFLSSYTLSAQKIMKKYNIKEIENKRAIEAAKESGEDYERQKVVDIQADDSDRWHRTREAKRNADPGLTDYEAATARQYQRLT